MVLTAVLSIRSFNVPDSILHQWYRLVVVFASGRLRNVLRWGRHTPSTAWVC